MAISQQDLTPSKDSYNNQMQDILWREITGNSMQELKETKFHLKNTDPRKVAYSFIVMEVMDKIGIEQTSRVLKVIALVQKIEGKITSDLAELENLLSELGMLRGKDSKGNATYPSKGQILFWLSKHGPELKKIWSDLFGKNGLMQQLKNALGDPEFKQKIGNGFNETMNLDKDSPFANGDWKFGDKGSFLDFLNGKMSTEDVATILHHVLYETYKNNISTKTPGYNDDIGDSKQKVETAKQLQNAMSTTESTEMSMYTQNLTSFIQIAQQVIQTASKETSTMVAQQNAR